jgi:hypothetical protein
LRTIRDELLGIEHLANLIENIDPYSVVRLIPVSSVGPGYATPEGSRMRKTVNAIPRPQYVEVPFLAILPDIIASAINSQKEDLSSSEAEQTGPPHQSTVRQSHRPLEKLVLALTQTIGLVGGIKLERLSNTVLQLILPMIHLRNRTRVVAQGSHLTQPESLPEPAKTPTLIAWEKMRKALEQFEAQMPASVLPKTHRYDGES